MTYTQYQIDRLRQEMEKNVAETKEFKNLIKKIQLRKGFTKETKQEYFMKKLAFLIEKENQCLKNEVKNQQATIEMLMTGDKCGNEWKVVKMIKSRRIPTKLLLAECLLKFHHQ